MHSHISDARFSISMMLVMATILEHTDGRYFHCWRRFSTGQNYSRVWKETSNTKPSVKRLPRNINVHLSLGLRQLTLCATAIAQKIQHNWKEAKNVFPAPSILGAITVEQVSPGTESLKKQQLLHYLSRFWELGWVRLFLALWAVPSGGRDWSRRLLPVAGTWDRLRDLS